MKDSIHKTFECVATFCFLSLNLVSAQTSGQPAETPSIFQLITNCPPITDLVFKYHFGVEPAELYEFRHQSNAFFVRITMGDSFNKEFSLQDTECARWGDDYWCYTYAPPPRAGLQPPPPVLNKYRYDSNDLYSIAYQSVDRYLLTRLRLFTSLGIAGDSAPGILLTDPENKRIVYEVLRQGITITAALDYSNSLPARSDIKMIMADGKVLNGRVLYRYKPGIANGRIPAYIEDNGGESIEVMRLSFGQTNEPMGKELFAPPLELLAMRNLQEVVHSNNAEYYYQHGRLVYHHGDAQADRAKFSQMAENALNSGIGMSEDADATIPRKYVLAIMIGFSVLSLVFILRLSYHRKKQRSG
ncbi:MAG: hypothetical protein ACLQSR_11060 [Limisphaerales bacterium]